jgi:hypothetical protein
MKESTQFAQIGPSIPVVPIGDFTKRPLTTAELETLWRITGPSAALNLRSNPLWRVIAMAYFEGLMHGAQLEAERHPIQKIQQSEPKEVAMPTKMIRTWNVLYNGTVLGRVMGTTYDDATAAANKLYAKWDFLTPV